MIRILFLNVILFLSIIPSPANADDYFNSPIVDAADQGKVYDVVKLLKNGTSPNVKGEFGTTALMRAAYKGNLDMVKILVEAGANINLTDLGGATALHLASRKGNLAVVDYLITKGAAYNIKDDQGFTAANRAFKNNDEATLARFADHQIKKDATALPESQFNINPSQEVLDINQIPEKQIVAKPVELHTSIAPVAEVAEVEVVHNAVQLQEDHVAVEETPIVAKPEPAPTFPKIQKSSALKKHQHQPTSDINHQDTTQDLRLIAIKRGKVKPQETDAIDPLDEMEKEYVNGISESIVSVAEAIQIDDSIDIMEEAKEEKAQETSTPENEEILLLINSNSGPKFALELQGIPDVATASDVFVKASNENIFKLSKMQLISDQNATVKLIVGHFPEEVHAQNACKFLSKKYGNFECAIISE